MEFAMRAPAVADLAHVLDVVRSWQHDAAAFQLHPGDVGWFWRFGADATAAALRVWGRGDETVAVGLIDDNDTVLRLGIAPELQGDVGLARRVLADVTGDDEGPAGVDCLESPPGAAVRLELEAAGWTQDEPWSVLVRDLTDPVPDMGVRVAVVDEELVPARVAVQRAAFGGSTFTVERWQAMAEAPAYAEARCLLAFTERGEAAAAVTVWSAGEGRPGLIEPMGADPEHRGQGFGRAVTVAAAAALREMGSSSATLCTPTSNIGGVATYRSAGFEAVMERRDSLRPA